MKLYFKKAYLLPMATVLLISSGAFASTRFSLFGVATSSHVKDTTAAATVTNTGVLNYGGGAQIEFSLGQRVGLEIGAVYLPRKTMFTDSASSVSVTNVYNYLQIPVQFRIYLSRYLNIGLGGYYARGFGNIASTSGSGSSTFAYSDLSMKNTDYGLMGSVGLNLPLSSSVAILAEGRYAVGMVDINSPTNPSGTTKWNDIQGIVGLRFGGGVR